MMVGWAKSPPYDPLNVCKRMKFKEWIEMSNFDYSLDELIDQMRNKYDEAKEEMGGCNILIIGRSGVGKSTLINAIFREDLADTGVGKSVTQHIIWYQKKDCPVTIYDTPGLEISTKGQIQELQKEVNNLIKKTRGLEAKKHIHIVWYCVNNLHPRFETIEENWLAEINQKQLPIILVLTRSTSQTPTDFHERLKTQNLPVVDIIPIMAKPDTKLIPDRRLEAHGLDKLVEKTADLLTNEAKKAFVREQTVSIDLKGKQALLYVYFYSASALMAGAIPIPLSDAPLIVIAQTTMLARITAIFGLPFGREFIGIVLAAIGAVGGVSAVCGPIVANLIKMIPGVGTIIGGSIAAPTAAAATVALGLAYIECLKIDMKREINGEKMSLPELKDLIIEKYKFYVNSGRKTLMGDN